MFTRKTLVAVVLAGAVWAACNGTAAAAILDKYDFTTNVNATVSITGMTLGAILFGTQIAVVAWGGPRAGGGERGSPNRHVLLISS